MERRYASGRSGDVLERRSLVVWWRSFLEVKIAPARLCFVLICSILGEFTVITVTNWGGNT